jgi:competence protein ComEC
MSRLRVLGFGCLIMILAVGVSSRLPGAGAETVRFLDIGQGDAALVTGRDRTQLLVDAGPDDTVMAQLGKAMPLTDRMIEMAVISHPHADHYRGFRSVLRRYRIKVLFVSAAMPDDPEYRAVLEDARHRGTEIRSKWSGNLQLADMAISFQTFGSNPPPRNLNNASVVMTVNLNGHTIFFPGDAEKEEEQQLVTAGLLHVEILKVPHHGSRTSSTEELLAALHAQYAVISVGSENRYGHPAAETVTRLMQHGLKVYRTDQQGAVTFDLRQPVPIISSAR